MQIFCNIVMFVNVVGATTVLILDIIRFPGKCKKIVMSEKTKNGSVDIYKLHAFEIQMVFVALRQILPASISIFTCLADGLTGVTGSDNEPYIWIPFLVYIIVFTAMLIALGIYFSIIKNKNGFVAPGISAHSDAAWMACAISVIYSIIPAQAIYTLVLLCAL